MNLRRLITLLTGLVSTLPLSACITSDTLIKIKPDGSGTVEQTILVNPKTFESFGAMVGQMTGADGKPAPRQIPTPADLLDEAKLKEAAARFGTGVRYVSSMPMKQGEMDGARALFAFDDINALNVSQSPDGGAARQDPVVFRFDRAADGGGVLTVTMPDPAPRTPGGDPASARGPQQIPPEAAALIKPFLQGFRIALAVDVQGALVRTNAEHVTGSRVTLLDVDFERLMENPAVFEKLTAVRPGASMSEVKPLLKDLPGVMINSSSSIMIVFK
jgi:hypothetical protein